MRDEDINTIYNILFQERETAKHKKVELTKMFKEDFWKNHKSVIISLLKKNKQVLDTDSNESIYGYYLKHFATLMRSWKQDYWKMYQEEYGHLEGTEKFDNGQACHSFALGSALTWKGINKMNQSYSSIGNEDLYDLIGKKTKDQKLLKLRTKNSKEISKLYKKNAKIILPINDMYLCGGYRNNNSPQVVPEHMWIEDRTNGVCYDTFINQDIKLVKASKSNNTPFRPGCEEEPFNGKENEIGRVKIPGYTMEQLLSIAASCKKENELFPPALRKTIQVKTAVKVIKELSKNIPKYWKENQSIEKDKKNRALFRQNAGTMFKKQLKIEQENSKPRSFRA